MHYQNSDTRAERLPKEKYELQNEEELSVAMVRKKTWVALTRTKESRPYASMATRHDNAIRHYCCRANLDIDDN